MAEAQKLEKPKPRTEIEQDGRVIAYSNRVVRNRKLGYEWFAGPDKGMTWEEAKSWAGSLTIDGGGWRMPKLKELETLYKKGAGRSNMTPLLKNIGFFYVYGQPKLKIRRRRGASTSRAAAGSGSTATSPAVSLHLRFVSVDDLVT